MGFAFVRLEKIADDLSQEYGRAVPLEDVVSACQELDISTSPIDLGDGRAALLCQTKHEENLKDYFHSKLAMEDTKDAIVLRDAIDTEIGQRLEAVEIRSADTSLMQKRINIVLANLEKRIAALEKK